MNWKEYKKKYNPDIIDETKFILGLDIGNSTSSISYFDFNRALPDLIDISGGYGKASIPTVVQYINDTGEWVFGEYAVLNRGLADEITFDNLIDNIGKKMYYDVGDRSVSHAYILSLFLKEIIGNIKNINPNADLVGIVASVPSYMNEDAKDEFFSAFKMAGYEKSLIKFISDRECLLQNYCFNKDIKDENILIIDFGDRSIRGGIYKTEKIENKINVNSISSVFDHNMSMNKIYEQVVNLFTNYYKEETKTNIINEQTKNQIESFAYQHKDLLFQNINNKKFKLYFNFAYPPFQKTINEEDVKSLVEPFKEILNSFLLNVFEKTMKIKEKMEHKDINTVLCSGGGFEMVWIRSVLEEYFPQSNIIISKNTKSTISQGACICASSILGVINDNNISVNDSHQLDFDIGLKINKINKFIPLIEKNSFWWQTHIGKKFIVNSSTENPFKIELFKRNEQGEIIHFYNIELTDMPVRPKGTTQIFINIDFESYDKIVLSIEDYGFGTLFPKSDYYKEFVINYEL